MAEVQIKDLLEISERICDEEFHIENEVLLDEGKVEAVQYRLLGTIDSKMMSGGLSLQELTALKSKLGLSDRDIEAVRRGNSDKFS